MRRDPLRHVQGALPLVRHTVTVGRLSTEAPSQIVAVTLFQIQPASAFETLDDMRIGRPSRQPKCL